jgi:hypothetical protein
MSVRASLGGLQLEADGATSSCPVLSCIEQAFADPERSARWVDREIFDPRAPAKASGLEVFIDAADAD